MGEQQARQAAFWPRAHVPEGEEAGPRRKVSSSFIRERLEQIRMDAAESLGELLELQQRMHGVLAQTRELWEATQPDACPDLEIESRVHRSA